MSRNKKLVVSTALAATVGIILAGCTATSPDVEPEQSVTLTEQSVTLTFQTLDSPDDVIGIQEGVNAWNEANPGIQVNLETVAPADALATYTRQVAAGDGPDIAQVFLAQPFRLGGESLAVDLTDLYAASPIGAGFSDAVGAEIVQRDGAVYGVPWSVDTFALAYRPELLEAAGIAEFPQTWEDLGDAAERLTADGVSGFCFPAGTTASAPIWHLINMYLEGQSGSALISGTGDNISSAEAVDLADALGYMNAFFTRGITPVGQQAVGSGDPAVSKAFEDGECAIAFLDPFSVISLSASDPTIRSSAVPAGNAGTFPRVGGRALVMNPNSEAPEAAWEFIQYLTSQEFFDNYYPRFFPAQKSLLADLGDGASNPLAGYATQLAQGRTYGDYILNVNNEALWVATMEQFGAVFSGQRTPEQGGDTWKDAIDGVIADS